MSKYSLSEKEFNDIFTKQEIFDDATLLKVSKYMDDNRTSLEKAIVELNIITDIQLGELVADFYKLSFVDLTRINIETSILNIIPEPLARKSNLISFKHDEKFIHLALLDPNQKEVIDFIEKKNRTPVKLYITTPQGIDEAIYSYSKDIQATFKDIIAENIKQFENASKNEIELPIIKIVDTIMLHAYQSKASDIHVEPEEEFSQIRFRIDGILHDILQIPPNVHEQVVSRIKVMCSLRTDEHQSAQDGKTVFRTQNGKIDLRISIIPITYGEKIVMRLLTDNAKQLTLEDLGFTGRNKEVVERAYHKPHGMILSTGPTGSGKTTSMYAIVKILNHREVNLMTIEDPIEYNIAGVSQIQVNTKTDLTFANGLRSILRQDPDIILVGEIRDKETAGIAVNASLTGHLVLSTLHTNDAATTIPRLIDMEIEPFLIASTVNTVIAQRLVRKICVVCRVSYDIQTSKLATQSNLDKKYFPSDTKLTLYRGKGCPVCGGTGYRGRVGIFEVIEIDDKVREAIIERKDSDAIAKIAIENGMTTLLEDGISKMMAGITTIDEILRVTSD